MNIPPRVILYCIIKLKHSRKYVVPMKTSFSDKKKQKLVKIDIKLSVESVRIGKNISEDRCSSF